MSETFTEFITSDHLFPVLVTRAQVAIGCRTFTRRQWDRVNRAFEQANANSETVKFSVQGDPYEVTKRGMVRPDRCKSRGVEIRRGEVTRINKALEKLDRLSVK